MKPTATSRADLLRCMRQGLAPDEAAAVLGYVRVREVEPTKLPVVEPEVPSAQAAAQSAEAAPAPEIQFPTERPRLKFLMPVRVESLAPPQPRKERGNPITDAELAVDWSYQGPALPPLTRWARLAPFLRSRLGTHIPGAGLDVRRLMKEVGKGLPLAVLPRRVRQAWAAQAVVLWDATAEMHPFQRDAQDLLRRLRRERGPHGLEVRLLRRLPRQGDAAHLPQGVPVLALSAMGQFQHSPTAVEAWLGLARRLGRLGHAFHALNPCPRDRWQPQVAAHWPSAVWDRRPRLPRQGGLSAKAQGQALAKSRSSEEASERLLTLLSPASRIEAPLLRTARLALGHDANAGTEWDAWHHEQCWHSLDCFGFHPGADYESRLNQRQALAGREAVLAQTIGGLMAAHHAGCSSVIAAEASLRALLGTWPEVQKGSSGFREARRLASEESAGSDSSAQGQATYSLGTLSGVKSLLQSVVDRLRLLAADPGSEEGRQSGLPRWFPGMVERLSESMRADEEVKKLIADGLAYAHAYLETAHVEVPQGVDGEAFQTAKAEVAKVLPAPVQGRVELAQGGWRFAPMTLSPEKNGMPLCGLKAARPPLHLTLESGRRHSYRLATPPVAVSLPALSAPQALVLESDMEQVHFQPLERPSWARKMWYDATGIHAEALLGEDVCSLTWTWDTIVWPVLDEARIGGPKHETSHWQATKKPHWAHRLWGDRFGLAADFTISGVPFVLRWIPPGRFLRGSPEDEVGRYGDEGPMHEVTLTRGYWLAETPVTQAQWRAVVQEAAKNQSWFAKLTKKMPIKPEPSHFQGDDLPVEQVNWHACQQYGELLNAVLGERLPAGFTFRLPTEAQWEYACRAGTQSAFHDGSACTKPEGLDPALDQLGWFNENSGSQTHPVKQKQPNAWGLYDMHGNVWEWCADGWADYPSTPQTDPSVSPEGRAVRVVRGGSWVNRARYCRAACRGGGDPGDDWHALGLRLAAGQNEPRAAEPLEQERSDLPERRSRARRADQ